MNPTTSISPKANRYAEIIIETITILLMVLFGLTAVDKLIHFSKFHTELGKSPFLIRYQDVVAWGTPLIELGVVLLLGIRRCRLLGLYLSVFLMVLFTGYVYLLLHYSYYTPCLCSAALESLTWEQHMIFNIVFLVFAITGVVLEERHQNLNRIS